MCCSAGASLALLQHWAYNKRFVPAFETLLGKGISDIEAEHDGKEGRQRSKRSREPDVTETRDEDALGNANDDHAHGELTTNVKRTKKKKKQSKEETIVWDKTAKQELKVLKAKHKGEGLSMPEARRFVVLKQAKNAAMT